MEAQHKEPVWRKKANFVIGAKITDPTWSKQYASEQLAVREQEDGTFELCCIPFMIYDLCLGDIVATDDHMNVNRIVSRSGRFGFRVATKNKAEQDWIINQLHNKGQLTERFSDKLCAVDAEDESTAETISSFLANATTESQIVGYETVKL